MNERTLRIVLAAALSLAIVRPAPAQDNTDLENVGNRDINDGGLLGLENASNVSYGEEIELGRAAAASLESRVSLLDDVPVSTLVPTDVEDASEPVVVSDDAVITAYVDRVGQRLAANSDARVPFTFRVIEDSSANGLALPGGFVYVNTGLLRTAGTEAELASALAHLIAHVAARHGVENQSKQRLLNIQSIPLIFVGGTPRIAISQAANVAVPSALLAFSRAAVTEADFLGIQYLYLAGYDPEAAVTLLERIGADSPDVGSLPSIHASHPPISDRVSRIRETIADVLPPRDVNISTTPEFEDVQRRLAAALPPDPQ